MQMPSQKPVPIPPSQVPEPSERNSWALWDENDPHSVVNLVPDLVSKRFKEARAKFPKLFGMEEKELHKVLSNAKLAPTPTERRLRAAFWLEYENAVANNRKMMMNAVYSSVCTLEIFNSIYERAPSRVAWLLCPPTQYQTMIESLLYLGLDQMEEILSLPLIDERGKVNTKLGELKAKIVAMLDMRAKGGITQRIEQKSLNINVGNTSKEIISLDVDQMEKRIAELEKKEKKVLHLEHQLEAMDAEAIPVEVKRGEKI